MSLYNELKDIKDSKKFLKDLINLLDPTNKTTNDKLNDIYNNIIKKYPPTPQSNYLNACSKQHIPFVTCVPIQLFIHLIMVMINCDDVITFQDIFSLSNSEIKSIKQNKDVENMHYIIVNCMRD